MKLTDIATHSDYLELMNATHLKKWQLHRKRVEFGRQSLKLEMFVTCDEEGNIIPKPTEKDKNELGGAFSTSEEQLDLEEWIEEYEKAKEKVLFEGFKLSTRNSSEVLNNDFLINLSTFKCFQFFDSGGQSFELDGNDIDAVSNKIGYLTLTPSAIKQLGL